MLDHRKWCDVKIFVCLYIDKKPAYALQAIQKEANNFFSPENDQIHLNLENNKIYKFNKMFDVTDANKLKHHRDLFIEKFPSYLSAPQTGNIDHCSRRKLKKITPKLLLQELNNKVHFRFTCNVYSNSSARIMYCLLLMHCMCI